MHLFHPENKELRFFKHWGQLDQRQSLTSQKTCILNVVVVIEEEEEEEKEDDDDDDEYDVANEVA